MTTKKPLTKRDRHDETISLIAASMHEGEQTRDIACPQCFGGASMEKSFSIRKNRTDIQYRCWRAGCGFRGRCTYTGGFLPLAPKEEGEIKTVHTMVPRRFLGRICPIPKNGEDFFSKKFDLTSADLDEGGVGFCPGGAGIKYSFPVHSPTYAARGVAIRNFDTNHKGPKWDAYPIIVDQPWMGWYIRSFEDGGPVVIVEDAISGLKVSRHFKTGYLNGTDIDIEKLEEIKKVAKERKVVLALDADATPKAIESLRQWSFYLDMNSFVAVPLKKDLKYYNDKEIRQICLP